MSTIEEYLTEWDVDSKINQTELANESTAIPTLHSKWLRSFSKERLKLKSLQIKKRKLFKDLLEYYKGDLNNPEDLARIEREPYSKIVMKAEINTYIETDSAYIEIEQKIMIQEEKVEVLDAIMRSINTRGFAIKNAVDFIKFCNGVV